MTPARGEARRIADVQVGDKVRATNPETGEEGDRTVQAVWTHLDVVYNLEMADGTVVTTTEDHPFYNLTDRERQRADKLDAGDTLRTADGSPARVAGLDSHEAEVAQAYSERKRLAARRLGCASCDPAGVPKSPGVRGF